MSVARALGAAMLAASSGLATMGCTGSIPVGAVLSQTGAASVYGEKVKKGLDLALSQINASGGYRGRRIELIYKDDATNPEIGRRVVEELIHKHGAHVIIGPLVSSVALAVAPLCEASHTVLLSPTASAPQISEAGEYVFRNYPSDVLEGTSMARFAKEMGLERMAVLAVDNEFGAGLKAVFALHYRSKLRQIVRAFDFAEGDVRAFGAMVQEVRALGPDGIYIVGYLSDVADLLRGIRGSGISSVILGASSVTEDIVRLAGGAAENLVFPQPSFDAASSDPAVRSFVEAYRSAYGDEPDTFAAHGYDALKLVHLALERGGGTRPDDVRRGLLGIGDYSGASGPAAFDDKGDVVQYPRLLVIRQGRAVPYDRFIEQGGSIRSPEAR